MIEDGGWNTSLKEAPTNAIDGNVMPPIALRHRVVHKC
jgi:hypothetical protein